MNQKELRYSFLTVIQAAESKRCKELHHKKKHQHKEDEMCPAEYELFKCANNIRDYMKNHV